MTVLKPPFPYFGGKTAVAEKIVALLPPHEHYVEPFAGSLAVLLAKPPSAHETVNDLNRELVTFWRMLRDRPADLERACGLTPHSRAEFDAAAEPADNDLEAARRAWVRLAQGRSAPTGRSTGWRYHQAARSRQGIYVPQYLANYVSRMAPAAVRLASVSLECLPALDLIAAYGCHESVLLYCDPPYLGSVRTAGANYAAEMPGDDGHRELLEALGACRAAVVLSGYASPLYDDLLRTWSRREISAYNGNGTDDKARTEVLWSNRQFPQGSLFDLEDAS